MDYAKIAPKPTSEITIMTWLREPNTEPIPGYRLISPLGSGGFGEVWKCEAPGGLFKAIKFVYGNLNSLDMDCARAEQELRALHRIKEVRHPFICSLDRIEVVNGELLIVMELAERTLHDRFEECQAAGLIGVPHDELLRYIADVSEALDHMNEKHNLQHLDVKPRNLFLIGERVKVADFGLVKTLERSGASGLLGGVTPLYAPPETFVGKISQHSDQYSLAIVYQELLTGQRPFTGKNVRQLAQQHLQEEPDLRSLPESERPIIARALSKDPNKRFPSCMAFVHTLYRARAGSRAAIPNLESKVEVFVGVGAGVGDANMEANSLRDIQLDDMGSDPSEEIDLGQQAPTAESGSASVICDLGVTIPQPETGALRPTLIIGVGAFGRKALLELRCRFLDRFGDLSKLPILRFLCIDPDPEALNTAIRGAPEVALTRGEFFHLPLQQVVNYRRRNLEHMSEWLPREKLYAMPRSLQTQGSRALGRLAFADNQQRLLGRLRKEIQEITNPDHVYQSVSQTGLALRDNTPRIYVIGAAGGGTSGLLPDLGYALRRLLSQLRHPESKVNAFLLGGAPQDPASPKIEQANVYATLTELNHYSDPGIAFAAQYGVDGQRIIDHGPPFSSVYMLTLQHRTPDALDETLAHLGNYLFHELTTPLGLRLEAVRQDGDVSASGGIAGQLAMPLHSFGTFAVWFPRGLLLRLAARVACRRLIEGWVDADAARINSEVRRDLHELREDIAAQPDFQPDAVAHAIEANTQPGSPTDKGDTPGEVLAGILAKLEEQIQQSVAQEDPGNWARQALSRIRDFVGSGEDQSINDWRKTRLTRALSGSAQKIAEQWDAKLSQRILALMEQPGARVLAAETAVKQLHDFCVKTAETLNERIIQQASRSTQTWNEMESSLKECLLNAGGGFRLFGGRSRSRQLRSFVDCLALFARMRLSEEIVVAVRHAYGLLAGRLADRSRDLGFVRQRLNHLQHELEFGPAEPDQDMTVTRPGADFTVSRSPIPSTDAFWEAIRQSNTARVVLPDHEQDLERASLRFLQTLLPEQWELLDKELHERVLIPRGGLNGACMSSGDLTRHFAQPLLNEAGTLLSQYLPIMDVAQILSDELEQGAQGNEKSLVDQLQDYMDRAVPLVCGTDPKRRADFLMIPASPSGRKMGQMAESTFPHIKQVRVAGQSDLMFCREQNHLTAIDLQKLLATCKAAYESTFSVPALSPHARFDISDWMPLDP